MKDDFLTTINCCSSRHVVEGSMLILYGFEVLRSSMEMPVVIIDGQKNCRRKSNINAHVTRTLTPSRK